MEHTIEDNQMPLEEPTLRSSADTGSLSVTCLFDADHTDLTKHLKNNHVQQSMLDEYLLYGFRMVQKKERELGQVVQALKILLEFGAKWMVGVLLEDRMTPHHLICQSNGDNHELLELIITRFHGSLINSKSHDGSTALLYAVQNANLNCAKSLIASGADVNLEEGSYTSYNSLFLSPQTLNPIVETIRRLKPNTKYSSIVMTDMLDLLLDSGVNFDKPDSLTKQRPIDYAISEENVQCVKKLIEKGARLDKRDPWGVYTCSEVARMGSVELLKCMFDHGIDKDFTDMEGQSLLSFTAESGSIEAMRYLLDLRVTITSGRTRANEISCQYCGKNRLLIDTRAERSVEPPYSIACEFDMLDVVWLLEEYGDQSFKSINALRLAVIHGSYEVVVYLLGKYKYPVNVEYALKCGDDIDYQNILTEACSQSTYAIVELLLDHGADPNKSICEKTCATALTTAIVHQQVDIVDQFIVWGVDVNHRSYDHPYDNVLPFDASILYNNKCAAELLLLSGCARGVFSLDNDHKFKVDVEPKLEKLMKEWTVHENNVTPLKIQCRREILKHLSPKADSKIHECSLPPNLVLYLSIPERAEIVEECWNLMVT